jgi:hypothetical protein
LSSRRSRVAPDCRRDRRLKVDPRKLVARGSTSAFFRSRMAAFERPQCIWSVESGSQRPAYSVEKLVFSPEPVCWSGESVSGYPLAMPHTTNSRALGGDLLKALPPRVSAPRPAVMRRNFPFAAAKGVFQQNKPAAVTELPDSFFGQAVVGLRVRTRASGSWRPDQGSLCRACTKRAQADSPKRQ